MTDLDRVPPHDPQNEAAAIGCALLDSSCVDVLLGTAKEPDFFFDLRHRTMLEVIRSLQTSFKPVNMLTVTTELNDSKRMDMAGGLPYVATMPDATPNAAHLDYALDKLRQKFIARRMIAACTEAVAQAYEHTGEADELIESFHNKVSEAGRLIEAREAKPAKEILRRCIDRYERIIAGEELGIATGFSAIDMQGGFQPGELVIVAGSTGMGKSTLALNLVHAAMRAGVGVGLFSLEMTDEAWMDRLLSLDLELDRRTFRSRSMFTEGVLRRIASNTPRLGKLPLWVCDDAQSTVEDIRRIAKVIIQRNHVRLLVVDYAQIVTPPKFIDSREQQVAYIGRSLRALAQETRAVVIVLSQLNDEGKIRESRALLHEAHLCLMMAEDSGRLWVRCAKGRDMQFPAFPVDFDPLKCRITQASQTDEH